MANGTVVADAVMVVPSGMSSDRVTYTPTLASAETVDIYAKWTENANRAETVTYRIHHAGGSTDILVNQQQPSGGWYHVGAFSMSPGQNHRDEVEGALEGETVADAMRFVSAGVSAPGISYVHADHLGSPEKMTDSAKTVVWDAVYTPFGQVHSITGTATNNQRFPGQYADAETGFSYNYFRDYDPTTGRYIQSDPIGLDGGLNTYSYVESNPTNFSDLFGLQVIPFPTPFPVPPLPPILNPNSPENQQAADATRRLLEKMGEAIKNLLDSISKMTAPGNVADTQIVKDYSEHASAERLCGREPPNRCDWLKKNQHRYSKAQVTATAKAWNCKHSRKS